MKLVDYIETKRSFQISDLKYFSHTGQRLIWYDQELWSLILNTEYSLTDIQISNTSQ